jgi:hypothetical protein
LLGVIVLKFIDARVNLSLISLMTTLISQLHPV